MDHPYESFFFDWLVAEDQPSVILRPEQGDVEWLPYPIPAHLGEGGFQKIELTLNMTVFRGVHRFKPAAVGRLIPLAKVEVSFPEPSFMVQILRGGRALHWEQRPQVEVMYGPGLDLFRLTDQLSVVPVLDGSQSSEMTCLTIGLSTLNKLIGEEVATPLLEALGLSICPQVQIRPTPLHVSAHLHGAIATQMTGAARRLYCQARVLDYLGALVHEVLHADAQENMSAAARDSARSVHELLLEGVGKLPTLDELAQQFHCSAKKLNDAFVAEYGQSIYVFMTTKRLEAAHAKILESNIPLKHLADQLGYSHVNHFITAFKRKFGYAPGSLRRK